LVLEKLLAKIEQYEEEENAQKMDTPESMSNDLTQYGSNSTSTGYENAPVLSLFNNAVVSHHFLGISKMILTNLDRTPGQWSSIPSSNTRGSVDAIICMQNVLMSSTFENRATSSNIIRSFAITT